MSAVHASRGPLDPPSEHLRSEVDIICSLALATLGEDSPVPWAAFREDYTEIRRRIARVVPGCASYEEKVDEPGGFVLPHPPRDNRVFETPSGRAVLTSTPLDVLDVPRGRFLLQTMRSHDQFNTTIYGLDDRYRGVKGGRRVVFVNPDDLRDLGYAEGDVIDLVSEWHDGVERVARSFRVVPYDQPRGCVAAYYPEANAARPAGLHGGEEQPAGLQVHRGPARPSRRGGPGTGRLARLARPGLGVAPRRPPAPPELSRPTGPHRVAREPVTWPAMTTHIDVLTSREVPLGGPRAMRVRRTLPQRHRSLIGAWCFVDHYGPDEVEQTGGMVVAPHPHTGLQTASWLFEGEIEHRDSAGNQAVVRPGELNLMTAGRGISHSEVSTPDTSVLHGAQLWIALPDGARDTASGLRALRARSRSADRAGRPASSSAPCSGRAPRCARTPRCWASS